MSFDLITADVATCCLSEALFESYSKSNSFHGLLNSDLVRKKERKEKKERRKEKTAVESVTELTCSSHGLS